VTSLLSGIGGKLVERWMLLIMTPAFAFWGGGVAAWAYHRSWAQIGAKLQGLSTVEAVALGIGALILVSVSGIAVQRATLPLLRLLEGYWPPWIALPVIRRRDRRIRRLLEERERLAAKLREETASAEERRRHLALDRRLRLVPVEHNPDELVRRMPTALGNVLRAAESWPTDKYGLDAVKCWSRLWLVLPEAARTELTAARTVLDQAAGLLLWAVLFVVWTVWAWWAAPIAIVVAFAAHRMVLSSAVVYGELLEASYDLHRRALYEAVRWPQPTSPADERALGEALTEYLWRGSDRPFPPFGGPTD
jgi:hypothetical protein